MKTKCSVIERYGELAMKNISCGHLNRVECSNGDEGCIFERLDIIAMMNGDELCSSVLRDYQVSFNPR